ncbi:MAG: TIGR01440 family protein [Bacillus sp. (in: firmicutes)]
MNDLGKNDICAKVSEQLLEVLEDLKGAPNFDRCRLLVVGCSTSEVKGSKIGTAGTEEVAAAIFQAVQSFSEKHGIKVAFQCCEHLNRALVVDADTLEQSGCEEVAVVPVRKAGGALAAYAYRNLPEARVVEHIQADAGIDIGDTFIGMHLKHVAVPVRPHQRKIGEAHVTMAVTRPKLIGGPRAVYDHEDAAGCFSE